MMALEEAGIEAQAAVADGACDCNGPYIDGDCSYVWMSPSGNCDIDADATSAGMSESNGRIQNRDRSTDLQLDCDLPNIFPTTGYTTLYIEEVTVYGRSAESETYLARVYGRYSNSLAAFEEGSCSFTSSSLTSCTISGLQEADQWFSLDVKVPDAESTGEDWPVLHGYMMCYSSVPWL